MSSDAGISREKAISNIQLTVTWTSTLSTTKNLFACWLSLCQPGEIPNIVQGKPEANLALVWVTLLDPHENQSSK